ncbi:MAG: hypothetical protein EX330_00115 [Candidatus Brocadia sp. BROELEC01]|nr:hypothetical protein [Candidatus Brocadia sapporoensis]QQR65880.1 MAG: hypothetical protein IPI25_09990 [Candidatus Brocadia sp.]RZV59621.1 MAG: hypothetical protein EX330_00115 [Candidatus Brocadia sp. BROELEC01]
MLMILLYAVFATFLCIFAIVSSSINERHIRKIRDTKINSQEYQNTGYRCGKDDLKYVFRTYDREDILHRNTGKVVANTNIYVKPPAFTGVIL